MNRHQTTFYLFISVAISAICYQFAGSSHPDSTDSDIVKLPILDQPRTVILFTAHPEWQTEIYQVTDKGPVKRLTLSKSASKKISFTPGQYFASTPAGRISIPVAKNQKVSHLQKLPFPKFWPKKQKSWSWIPPGPVLLGDRLGIGAEDERPRHLRNIPGFWLGKTEVTNQQFAKFLNESKSFQSQWIDLRSRKCGIKKQSDGTFQATLPDHPVVMVSHLGAEAYCRWMTQKTGEVHRLPSEWEWEKAAAGPESSIYSYGNVYFQNKANQESGRLEKVASYSPNGYGLYDMTGNVFEWTSSRFNPKLDSAEQNQSLRGGSFVLDGMYLRNSFRMKQSPDIMTDDFGFRVLREPKKSK